MDFNRKKQEESKHNADFQGRMARERPHINDRSCIYYDIIQLLENKGEEESQVKNDQVSKEELTVSESVEEISKENNSVEPAESDEILKVSDIELSPKCQDKTPDVSDPGSREITPEPKIFNERSRCRSRQIRRILPYDLTNPNRYASSRSRSKSKNSKKIEKNSYLTNSNRYSSSTSRSRSENSNKIDEDSPGQKEDEPKLQSPTKKQDKSQEKKKANSKQKSKEKEYESEDENIDHLDIKNILKYEKGDDGEEKKIYEKPIIRGWRLYDRLGKGTYGQVFRVYRKKFFKHQDGALKIGKNSELFREDGIQEVSILDRLRKLDPTGKLSLCSLMLDWFDYHGHICIVFELFGLSVQRFITKNRRTPFTLEDIQIILYQLNQALDFLHLNSIVHTDIKTDNMVFVDSSSIEVYNPKTKKYQRSPRNLKIRLIDFGSAVAEDDYHFEVVTTSSYRSPEVRLELSWSYPIDIWAMGCVAYQLFKAKYLFTAKRTVSHLNCMIRTLENPIPRTMLNESERQNIVKKLDLNPLQTRKISTLFNKEDPEEYKLFKWIEFLLIFDPELRPNSSQALRHSYFEGVEKKLPTRSYSNKLIHTGS